MSYPFRGAAAMPRGVVFWVVVTLIVAAAGRVVRGATTIGSLDATGYNPSSGHLFFGQIFTVPAGETGLVSGTLLARNGMGAARTGTLSIREWDGSASILDRLGVVLASVPVSVPDGAEQPVVGTFNLPVSAGEDYALILQWDGEPSNYNNAGGYYSNFGYYAGGSTLFASGTAGQSSEITTSDNAFQVAFGVVPEPATLVVLPLAMLALTASHRRRVPT